MSPLAELLLAITRLTDGERAQVLTHLAIAGDRQLVAAAVGHVLAGRDQPPGGNAETSLA